MEEKIFAFIKAQAEAEEKGDHAFVCPVCGNEAYWVRAMENGHLHARCESCAIAIME